jgi:FkbM family methyltransferase
MTLRDIRAVRNLLWRGGRKIYAYARGESANDPHTNGEYLLLRHILESGEGADILLDIGANRGDWTAKALQIAQATRRIHVHAFEPSTATRASLSTRFTGDPAVTVHALALSSVAGEAAFFSVGAGAGTNSLSPIAGAEVESVVVTTIDVFVRQSGIVGISIAKIDAEGFDLLVLRGARESLRLGLIEVIQFEYNWRWLLNNACLRDVFVLVADTPYRIGKLVGDTVALFSHWHPELDRFFEGNYVLLRSDRLKALRCIETTFDASNVAQSVIVTQ